MQLTDYLYFGVTADGNKDDAFWMGSGN